MSGVHHPLLDPHISCDLTVPTFPTDTKYDGRVEEVRSYLRRVRPVGWLEEMSKLQDMRGAAKSPHLIDPSSWQVKMRLINRTTVLPSQVGPTHPDLYPTEPPLPE